MAFNTGQRNYRPLFGVINLSIQRTISWCPANSKFHFPWFFSDFPWFFVHCTILYCALLFERDTSSATELSWYATLLIAAQPAIERREFPCLIACKHHNISATFASACCFAVAKCGTSFVWRDETEELVVLLSSIVRETTLVDDDAFVDVWESELLTCKKFNSVFFLTNPTIVVYYHKAVHLIYPVSCTDKIPYIYLKFLESYLHKYSVYLASPRIVLELRYTVLVNPFNA